MDAVTYILIAIVAGLVIAGIYSESNNIPAYEPDEFDEIAASMAELMYFESPKAGEAIYIEISDLKPLARAARKFFTNNPLAKTDEDIEKICTADSIRVYLMYDHLPHFKKLNKELFNLYTKMGL